VAEGWATQVTQLTSPAFVFLFFFLRAAFVFLSQANFLPNKAKPSEATNFHLVDSSPHKTKPSPRRRQMCVSP